MKENSLENTRPERVFLSASEKLTILNANSKYNRSTKSPDCTLTNEQNEEFKVKVFKDGSDPRLGDVQELFNKVFKNGEVEPEDMLRFAVDGMTPWGTPDAKYKVVGIQDAKDKLLAICAGTTLLTKNTSKIIHCVEYTATTPDVRQSGLGREAYISALLDAVETAKNSNLELSLIIGECTNSSELFWDNLGWKRIYIKQKDGMLVEAPYIQPALVYDTNTGEISENADEIKEHLMLDFFTKKPNKKDIIDAHKTIIRHAAEWPRQAFLNDKAYEKHLSYLTTLEKIFQENINKSNEEILFLNYKEIREQYNLWLEKERERLLKNEVQHDYIAPSKIMEEGLFAKHDFNKEEIISEYLVGRYDPLVTLKEIKPGTDMHRNSIQIDINEKGEGLYVGVPRRHPRNFENHSCDPNAGLKVEEKPDGTKNYLLIAIKPIKTDEEITLDYSTLAFEDYQDFDNCNCGNKNCRKKITKFQDLPKKLQNKYIELGIIPKFATDLIKK